MVKQKKKRKPNIYRDAFKSHDYNIFMSHDI